jgi:acetylserotonin O-methyltransferase
MMQPDPGPVLDLIEAFRRSKTMFTAVRMGIFDLLHGAPRTAADLAATLAADCGALGRLLDACAALGLLEKRNGVYANSTLAETYLCASSPHTLSGYVRYSDEALYPMWGHLADAVRECAPRWKQSFGLDGPIFSAFFRTDEAMRDFVRGMHGFGMLTSPTIAGAFDLGRFRRIADLGGATGHLVMAMCDRYPAMRGVLFDLPRTAAVAREYVTACAAADRIEIVEGDFFQDDLPEADLYALGRILHDWDEPKIERLLARIASRLPVGGALLIAEKLMNEDGVGPVGASMQSLNMLIVTEGRERSLGEYTALLERAGFTQIEGRRTGAYLDAILAVK